MSLRVLFGILGRMLEHNASEIVDLSEKEPGEYYTVNLDFQSPAKFHIGMLAISLLAGLGYGGFIAYACWKGKDIFLGYIRNFVIALTCRTFFSILFDGVILLGSPLSVGGGNTLLSFQQIFLNLVLAFWLSLTVYMHARVQRNFNSEPTLRLYQYGIPGVAVFFAFVWIFTLQDQLAPVPWWIFLNPLTQWIVNSLNLLFVLIQLGLVIDMGRMIMTKTSLDQDSSSMLWKSATMMGILVFIIWLQFGMTLGLLPGRNSQGYLYFYYLIDGLECAFVCACMYFFYKWVQILIKSLQSLTHGTESPPIWTTETSTEALIPKNDVRGIFTLDRVFMTVERDGKLKHSTQDEGAKDVVYSNIVEPDRLKKTLDLYKRLNAIPGQEVTIVEGEEFYDCQISTPNENNKFSQPQQDLIFKQKVSSVFDEIKFKNDKRNEQIQKKNAFYSSKYLILDTKEGDFPKYLETRPSISYVSEKGSPKDEQTPDFPSNVLESGEMVKKWLDDFSEDMQIYDEPRKRVSLQQEKANIKNTELNLSNDKFQSDTKEETGATGRHPESPSQHVSQEKEKSINAIVDEITHSDVDKKQLVHREGRLPKTEAPTADSTEIKQDIRASERLPRQPIGNSEPESRDKLINHFPSKERTENHLPPTLSDEHLLKIPRESKTHLYIEPSGDVFQEKENISGIVSEITHSDEDKKQSDSQIDKQMEIGEQKTQISGMLNNDVANRCEEANAAAKKIRLPLKDIPDNSFSRKKEEITVEDNKPQGSDKNVELEHTEGCSNQSLINLNMEPDQNKVHCKKFMVTPVEDFDGKDAPKKFHSKIITYSELQNFRSKRGQFTDDRQPTAKNSLRLQESIVAGINSLINTGIPKLKAGFLPKSEDTTADSAEIKQDVRASERLPVGDSEPESRDKLINDFPGKEQTVNHLTPSLPDENLLKIPRESKSHLLLESPGHSLQEKDKNISGIVSEITHSDVDKKQLVLKEGNLPKTEAPTADSTEIKQDVRTSERLPKEPTDLKPESGNKLRNDFAGKEQTANLLRPTFLQDKPVLNLERQSKTHKLTEPNKTNRIPIEHDLGISSDFELEMDISKKYPKGSRRKHKAQKDISKAQKKKPKLSEHSPKEFFHDFNKLIYKTEEGQEGEILKPVSKLHSATTLKEDKMDLHDTEIFSSDSEFSIERKKSSSSADSFSVEQYYLQMMEKRNQFINQQDFYQKKNSLSKYS